MDGSQDSCSCSSFELPSHILSSIFLHLITEDESFASLEALLEAIPSLAEQVLLITDHGFHVNSPPPVLFAKIENVSRVSLDDYGSSHSIRFEASKQFRIFSYINHIFRLDTQTFNASSMCLYGRYLSRTTPLSLNLYGKEDSSYGIMQMLAEKAHVPVIIPTSVIPSIPMDFEQLERNLYGSYRLEDDPPITDDRTDDIQITTSRARSVRPTLSRLDVNHISLAPEHYQPLIYIHDHSFYYLVMANITLKSGHAHNLGCCSHDVACCTPHLKRVYLSFDSCLLPRVLLLPKQPMLVKSKLSQHHNLKELGFDDGPTLEFASINEERLKELSLLETFTWENKRWSIHHPYGDLACFSLPNGDHVEWPMDNALWTVGLATNQANYTFEFMVRSKRLSLIGIPAHLVLDRIAWEYVQEFSWWKLSSRPPDEGQQHGALQMKLHCPALKKLKVFAVVTNEAGDIDPPLLITAPLLQVIQLVGLANSDSPWSLGETLTEPSTWSILKDMWNGRPGLTKVLLGQYLTDHTGKFVDWVNLRYCTGTVVHLAIVGYVPRFTFWKGYCSGLFYSLKSLCVDITWIPLGWHSYRAIDLFRASYPHLVHLKLLVPDQSWCIFEDFDLRDIQELIIKVNTDIKCLEHITLSSVLLHVTVIINIQNLTPIDQSNIPIKRGLEYTWSKGLLPATSRRSRKDHQDFQLNLGFKGQTFAEEWCFENPIYNTYTPSDEPVKHYLE